MSKTLNIIVCCDKNMGIGKNNKLPWNISSEMKLFREKTIGNGNNCVIMGKNTYLSIPEKYRPLSKRFNCIVSSNYSTSEPDTKVINNIDDELIEHLNNTKYDTYWIIGGSSIYHTVIEKYSKFINEIHISLLETDYNCDVFFPTIDKRHFSVKEKIHIEQDKYTHYVYKNDTMVV